MENIGEKIDLKNINIPKRNIIFYLFCIGSIIVFFLLFLWPEHRTLKEKNLKIKTLKSKLDSQKLLFPFYNILSTEIKRIDQFDDIILFSPENVSLPCDIQAVLLDIRKECLANKFEIKNIKTDLNALNNNFEHLKMQITIQGNFLNLSDFLIQLGKISCVEYIEYIRVESAYPAKNIEIKFCIAQQL